MEHASLNIEPRVTILETSGNLGENDQRESFLFCSFPADSKRELGCSVCLNFEKLVSETFSRYTLGVGTAFM